MGRKKTSGRSNKGQRSRTNRRKKDATVEKASIKEEDEKKVEEIKEQNIPAVPDDAGDRDLVMEALKRDDLVLHPISETSGKDKKKKEKRKKGTVITAEKETLKEEILKEEAEKKEAVETAEKEILKEETGKIGTVEEEGNTNSILIDMIHHAWKDGIISDDEMSLLRALKERFNVDDGTFDRIISEAKPPHVDIDMDPDAPLEGDLPEPEGLTELLDDEEDLEEDENDLDMRAEMAPVIEDTFKGSNDRNQPVPETGIPDLDQGKMVSPRNAKLQPAPELPASDTRNIISFTSYVRDSKRPLGESFDLKKKEGFDSSSKKKCPRCGAIIHFSPELDSGTCPSCGENVSLDKLETPGIRRLLDQARSALKGGDRNAATELYTIVITQSPKNKEAQFYLQKLHHQPSGKKPVKKGDARNIDLIKSLIPRLDQILNGGVPSGSQVLVKGPAFSGKEVVFDKVMAYSLSKGIPVIYVSSNRAMKEVMYGIIRQVPDFRRYNQEGLVRMYDLFSKHMDGRVLKEGHRIFNIEDREDFKRFQTDLVSLTEELVQDFHGGVLLINSLSPLISQTDFNDLMKFLQVLIARSKSYRFTNFLDMAAGVHPESIENSIEYLMDGILEFRERDNHKNLRLRGFHHGVLSRDWIEYRHTDIDIQLVGPFQEERIL
ncbi:MAG: ATPase domain-containing protein [Thermoplasmatota archaeon]